ncbi:GntR family transcriptional regulator [Polymorphobacter sp.]|uniref:GntR family transcriptional regulator n=1 Tax=Polymorphobacter sp. TaxID=1909290 RepID=UPI003F718A95
MSSASDLAYETIRGRILSGALAPMTQLKEEELAEMCGLSRTPVRDALRRLEAEMLVRRTDTQRTFVPDWSADEVEEIFLLRGLLESYAAARAARLATAEEIAMLQAFNDEIERAIEGPTFDTETFVANNRSFHNLILTIANSERLTKMRSMIVEQGILHRTARRYDKKGLRRSHADHEELLMAFKARDEAWASAIITGHNRRAFRVTAITGA